MTVKDRKIQSRRRAHALQDAAANVQRPKNRIQYFFVKRLRDSSVSAGDDGAAVGVDGAGDGDGDEAACAGVGEGCGAGAGAAAPAAREAARTFWASLASAARCSGTGMPCLRSSSTKLRRRERR